MNTLYTPKRRQIMFAHGEYNRCNYEDKWKQYFMAGIKRKVDRGEVRFENNFKLHFECNKTE